MKFLCEGHAVEKIYCGTVPTRIALNGNGSKKEARKITNNNGEFVTESWIQLLAKLDEKISRWIGR